jgi:uncharacterized protein YebE (UPF0316 family)
MDTLWSSLEMAGLAMMSVGLWTLRVALTARGRKVAGSLTAAAEALVFLFAFSSVMADVDAIERVVGYAIGVGLGTLLGVFIDERLSAGQSEVRIVTPGTDLGIMSELQALGWPVTVTSGHGPDGEVTVGFVAVDDMKLRTLTKELQRRAPDAFWTVETLKKARASELHPDWIQVHKSVSLRRGAARPLPRT